MGNKGFKTGFLLGVLATIVLIVGIGVGVRFAMPSYTTVNQMSSKKMDLIEQLIDAYYFGDVSKNKMTEGTYKGIVEGLNDPYSMYFTKKEYKAQLLENAGKYVGIGALVSKDDKTGVISIVRVYDNSPAKKAGLTKFN